MGWMRLAVHTPMGVPIEYIGSRLCVLISSDGLHLGRSYYALLEPYQLWPCPIIYRPQCLLPCSFKWRITGDFSIEHPTA